MKSSITTMSVAPSAGLGAGGATSAALPVVIRAAAAPTPGSSLTPRNESCSLPGLAGAAHVPRLAPLASKSWIVVAPAWSTSLNTTPRPFVCPCVSLAGITNPSLVTLLPTGENSRSIENGANSAPYVGLRLVNST